MKKPSRPRPSGFRSPCPAVKSTFGDFVCVTERIAEVNSCSPLKALIVGSPPIRAREKSYSASWSSVTYFFRSPAVKTTLPPRIPYSFTSASARARFRTGSIVSTVSIAVFAW